MLNLVSIKAISPENWLSGRQASNFDNSFNQFKQTPIPEAQKSAGEVFEDALISLAKADAPSPGYNLHSNADFTAQVQPHYKKAAKNFRDLVQGSKRSEAPETVTNFLRADRAIALAKWAETLGSDVDGRHVLKAPGMVVDHLIDARKNLPASMRSEALRSVKIQIEDAITDLVARYPFIKNQPSIEEYLSQI